MGAPSVIKDFGKTPCAWSPGTPQSDKGEWISVGFSRPMPIKQVIIAEVNNPGAIVKVIAKDEKGKNHELYQNKEPGPVPEMGRIFKLNLDRITPYKVTSIKLILHTDKVFGWNQIDAIGICNTISNYEPRINLPKEEVEAEIQRLPTSVNSKFDELCPIISANGKTLFFTRDYHPGNMGIDHHQDIWYSRINENGTFSNAKNV